MVTDIFIHGILNLELYTKLTVYTVTVLGKCLIVSYETELELRLNKLNSQIILWSKISRFFKFKLFKNKIYHITDERNNCFKELRTLIRKKYPEKFIGANYD